jgi:hypothetical protein
MVLSMKLLPPRDAPWNYRFLAMAFAAGVFAQVCVLLTNSQQPAWPYACAFAAFDVLVLIRIAFARLRSEANRGWLVYSVLCAVFLPLLAIAVDVATHVYHLLKLS